MQVRRLGVVLAIVLLPSAGGAGAATNEPPPSTIAVHVRDYAAIPAWRWRLARHEVDYMLSRLDLRISWSIDLTGTKAEPTAGLPNVTVLILSPAMVQTKCQAEHLAETVLGSSAKEAGRAWVFYDRIASAADNSGVNPALLLARTITHELGHLIAGLSHTEYGIMRAYAELIPGGFQEFQEPQKRAMRDAVARATTSPSPVLALRAMPEVATARTRR